MGSGSHKPAHVRQVAPIVGMTPIAHYGSGMEGKVSMDRANWAAVV